MALVSTNASGWLIKMSHTIEDLLAPVTPTAFFENYYEQKALHVPRNDRSHYQELLGLEDIDHHLAAASPTYPDAFLTKAGQKLEPEDYTYQNADGILDVARVAEHIRGGATLVLRHHHLRHSQLAQLCRAMEVVFSAPFQTNIYLTPANAQGFGTHFDSHDVFVLQVSGSKKWTLYNTEIPLPLHGQAYDKNIHRPGMPTQEFTLEAGDVFYCPRGLYHSARSTHEHSLHITLGLMGRTWADVLLEAVSAACLTNPAFRRNLPVGFARDGFDRSEAERTFRGLLDALSGSARLSPILDQFADDFIVSRRVDGRGLLRSAIFPRPLGDDDHVRMKPNAIYRMIERDDGIEVQTAGATLMFPSNANGALTRLEKGATVSLKEIADLIGSHTARAVIEGLLNDGVLEIA